MEPLNINYCFSFTYIYKSLLAYKVQVCLVFTKMRSYYAYYFETGFSHLKISETSFQIYRELSHSFKLLHNTLQHKSIPVYSTIFHCIDGEVVFLFSNSIRYFQSLSLLGKTPCFINWHLPGSTAVQFSCSVMFDSLWPHGLQHTRPPCPSLTPRIYSNSCPLNWWCHPTISSSVVPFSSCPQSLPASGSFQMSQFFASDSQSIGVSATISVLPMNIQDWFPLGWTGWISL